MCIFNNIFERKWQLYLTLRAKGSKRMVGRKESGKTATNSEFQKLGCSRVREERKSHLNSLAQSKDSRRKEAGHNLGMT